MSDEIMVSISCLTYNHEPYIRKCLDGFVMQKTNFKFEVLIHDDASTDKTADIIREYEAKYPDIIKPIYQTENQHSQHVPISRKFQYPRIKGKYYAICEGDDYWIDDQKLQKQFDFMESHPDYSMCVHRAIFRQTNIDGTFKDSVFPNIKSSKDYSVEEAIIGGGSLISTNSMFSRSKNTGTMPSCFKAKGFGDYQAFVYGTICGKVHCMEEVMSVYNYCTPGSWTSRVWSDNSKKIDHLKEEIRMLGEVDKHYEYKYHDAIQSKIHASNFKRFLLENNKKELNSDEFRSEYKMMKKEKRHKKILTLVEIFCPFLFTLKGNISKN